MPDLSGWQWTRSQLGIVITIICMASFAHAQERANYFNDPFVQVTDGIANCPIPEGPMITRDEMRFQAHIRVEQGTRCHMSGRCRLANSYQYDQEIISRVKKAIEADGRFVETSVWAEGQRRWVTLKGCVHTKSEAETLARLVRSIDDVVTVVNQLIVKGDRGARTAAQPK